MHVVSLPMGECEKEEAEEKDSSVSFFLSLTGRERTSEGGAWLGGAGMPVGGVAIRGHEVGGATL